MLLAVRLLAAACGDQDNNRGTGPTEEEAAALAAYTAAFNAEDTERLMQDAAPDVFLFHAGITRG